MTVLWPNGSTSIPRVSSEYGMRTHPVTGAPSTMHNGIDLVGWSTIVAPVAGTIIYAGYNGGAGNEVRIQGDDGNFYRLLHNRSFIRTGGRVYQGEPVAIMGTTGSSTGVHCHFETHYQRLWNTQNPRTFMANANSGSAGEGGGAFIPPIHKGDNMFLIYDAGAARPVETRQYVLITVDGGHIRARFLEDKYERAVFLAMAPALSVTACDTPTFNGFLARVGYSYGAPIPLVPVKAEGAEFTSNPLK